jgi:Tfp pilus assembly protein PilE
MGLIDLMLAVIIASLLMAVAVPAYDRIIDRARVARAIGDIGSISIAIERFGIKNNRRCRHVSCKRRRPIAD